MRGCVFDTDVVIGVLDDADAHHALAAEAVRAMVRGSTPLAMSVVNYAEALIRPAGSEQHLRAAVAAIDALGIAPHVPTPALARDAARLRNLGISLADGFALATAKALNADVATFDRRVRRALGPAGLELAAPLRP